MTSIAIPARKPAIRAFRTAARPAHYVLRRDENDSMQIHWPPPRPGFCCRRPPHSRAEVAGLLREPDRFSAMLSVSRQLCDCITAPAAICVNSCCVPSRGPQIPEVPCFSCHLWCIRMSPPAPQDQLLPIRLGFSKPQWVGLCLERSAAPPYLVPVGLCLVLVSELH